MNRICRGCAGTGLRYDHPRRDIAAMSIRVPEWTSSVTGRHVWRVIPGVGNERTRGKDRWTALDVLNAYEHLIELEAEPMRPLNFDRDDLCDWCHGTGHPQLSVHALQGAAT